MIYCTCNVSVLETIIEILESCHVRDYQILDHVNVKNKKGEPRLNNPVWPGYNSSIFMQIKEDEKVQTIIQHLKSYNHERFDDELVTVCSWNIENYFYD